MHESFDLGSFLVGLPLGILIASIILFISWRKGKKERRFDERYTRIHEQARSFSWRVTTATILIVWGIIIVVEGPRLAFFLMTGIWVAHMLSYAIGAAIASSRN
ncbi:hypothetical protein OXB_0196 [Bacillus sp. OxB-1]|uniref:hypothetical protein n=1 Tax=Bacillus sp. (strain OxB-1) TaxID=98228 RepID=UPI000581C129|nr:hypothetical protein [Bacillus sp. OxB-1]BAQ08668.1 hypothetical protein OXB_0196 [Bacillus sp. OxB-1]